MLLAAEVHRALRGGKSMKFAAFAAFAVALGMGGPAFADGLQSAFAAVGSDLQAKGGGLAALNGACPKSNNDEWEYLASALFVPISAADSAVLVNTGRCNGGNGSGQYLVLNQGGTARVVKDAGIADMSFLATNAYFIDGVLTLYGNRWLPADAHCCPSKKATLEFNLKTGSRKLTVLDGDN
jgi:hypothetical protein